MLYMAARADSAIRPAIRTETTACTGQASFPRELKVLTKTEPMPFCYSGGWKPGAPAAACHVVREIPGRDALS
jgi:hypothetical protein